LTKAVVYTGTRNLYRAMLPAISSLLAHTKADRVILLIEDDEFPYRLPSCCETVNVSGQTFFTDASPNWNSWFKWIVMMRCTYAKLFPELDRILQLDVDTIICDDLSPLWEIDLTGKYFAAVPEYHGNFKPYGPKYYNIGPAMFNLDEIRKDGIDDQVIRMVNTEKLPYVEQDAWNKLGIQKAYDLPVRYNETPFTGYTGNPAVVHFAGCGDWYTNRNVFRYEYLEKWKDLPEDCFEKWD